MNPRRLSASLLIAAAGLLSLPATSLAVFDGSLDPAFDGPLGGGNGKFTHVISGSSDQATDVLVQPDGKILVVGSDNGGSDVMVLARFLAGNGALDTGFDGPTGTGNGDFTLDLSATGITTANAVTLDSQGRILIGGSADVTGTGRDDLVVRLDQADGDLDATFGGGDGFSTTSFTASTDSVSSITVDSSDRPILGGSSNNDFTVARFESDGDPDNTFSGDGRQTVDLANSDTGNGILVQPADGKIVIGARTSTGGGGFDFGMARLNPADGSLDTSFDGPASGTSTPSPGNGKFAIPLSPSTGQDVGTSLLMQGTDKILVGGEAAVGAVSSFAIIRLDVSDGDLDTTFDGDGLVTTDITASSDQIQDMEIDSKGRIVAAGFGLPSGDEFAVARYSADGVLDPFFDGDSGTGNGKVEIPFTGGGSARGLALESDGDLVLAGESGATTRTTLARLKVDLTPPNTFTSGPTGSTNNANPVFSITSTETASSVQCTIDSSPVACTIGAGQQFGPFADGSHTLNAAAVDESGNIDPFPASRTFTVDTVAPNGSITPGSGLTNDSTPTFSVNSNEAGSTFECKVDPPSPAPAGSFAPCTSSFTPSALPDGTSTITVRTTDAAGNLDASDAVATVDVDATAPETTVTGAPPSVSFSSSESPATFECSLDGAPFAACTSPQAIPAQAPGAHIFAVRSTDLAGNVDPTPASLPFTVQAPAPPAKKCKKGQKLKKGKCIRKKKRKK